MRLAINSVHGKFFSVRQVKIFARNMLFGQSTDAAEYFNGNNTYSYRESSAPAVLYLYWHCCLWLESPRNSLLQSDF